MGSLCAVADVAVERARGLRGRCLQVAQSSAVVQKFHPFFHLFSLFCSPHLALLRCLMSLYDSIPWLTSTVSQGFLGNNQSPSQRRVPLPSDSVLKCRQALLPSQLASAPPVILILRFSQLATLTPVIAVGGVAERARFLPILVVTFLWATIVYNPVAHWTWSATGWGYVNGVLDVCLVYPSTAFHR
jgi:hypothetical protein